MPRLIWILTISFTVPLSTHLSAQHSFARYADSMLAGLKTDNAPGGAIAIIKNGKTVYETTYGMANIEKKTPVNYETQFWIASVTKQFTAAAVYLLAAEGRIDVKQSLTKYLPGLPELYNDITIDHLLHHTSGIRDGFVLTALSKKPESEYTNENVLKYLSKQKELNFTPGSQYEYNNSGYVLLAMIIEKITNEKYPDFLLFHLFMPSGMNNTFVTGKYTGSEKMAEGYRKNNESFQPAHFSGNSYGSTGVITTLRDLELWAAQFQSLSSTNKFNAVINEMKKTSRLNNGQQIAYGGGIEKLQYNGKDVFEHFGADEGFKANIIYFPSTNVSVIGLTNNANDYTLSKRLYEIASMAMADSGETKNGTHLKTDANEYDYFDASSTTYRKVKLFGDHAEVTDVPGGHASRYVQRDGWLIPDEVIPSHRLRIKGDQLLIDDLFYQSDKKLKKINKINFKNHVSSFAGEYYSDELETTYNILNKEGQLVFEFYPGAEFPLERITDNVFVFEYAGANYLNFAKRGLLFSREGIKNLKLNRQ